MATPGVRLHHRRQCSLPPPPGRYRGKSRSRSTRRGENPGYHNQQTLDNTALTVTLPTRRTITGKVTGEDGKPLAGILVTLKESMEAPRPKFISEGSAADGTFSMKVPPGKYFAVGRESVQGGKPAVGSYIGSYGKTNPSTGESAPPPNVGSQTGASPAAKGLQSAGGGQALAIEGKEGEVIGNIDIQMFKIPDPVETRAKFEAEATMGAGGPTQSDPPDAKQGAPTPVDKK